MKTTIYQWGLIIGSALLFIVSDSLSALWARNESKIVFFSIFLIAPAGYVLFGILNKSKSLSVSSALVNILLLVGTILVGILGFKDQISYQQGLGLIFAVIAVALLA